MRRQHRGFTLIELIVVMAIVALLVEQEMVALIKELRQQNFKPQLYTWAPNVSNSLVALAGPGEGGKSNNEYANPTIFTMSVDAAPLAVVAGDKAEMLRGGGIQRVIDQCGFSGTRNARDANEQSDGNSDGDILKVVAGCALHHELALFIERVAQCGHRGLSNSSMALRGLGLAPPSPSSSSSANRDAGAAGFGSSLGGSALGLAAAGLALAAGSSATNGCPQCLHLIFLPNTDSGTLSAFAQFGHGISVAVGISGSRSSGAGRGCEKTSGAGHKLGRPGISILENSVSAL